ncbi:alkaline phosphatase family protein [Hyphococcus sp. DH-69]|uniref:nucleotide pyrophosphatase/phosphodiesterase family protein n=1 Tax=Hyphococcus formosus TaxID=3143534 RepID=UPI00398B74A4
MSAIIQSLKKNLLSLCFAGCLAACATPPIVAGTTKAAASTTQNENDQYVILIGLDGLRNDAIDRFPEAAPNLRALAASGVRAKGMYPSMPSVTFVNFYALATGLHSENTGIVSNSTYSRHLDRVMARSEHSLSEWWGGEPIWVTAEIQGVKAGTMFWLGSEAEIGGVRPSYWLPYEHMKPYDARTEEVLSWLAKPIEERPRFVTIYFHAVDSAAHVYGVGSKEERQAIAEVDAQVGALMAGVEELGLGDRANFIVVSDHGMANVPDTNIINLDQFVSFDGLFIPEFHGPDGAGRSPLIHIFDDGGDIDAAYAALSKASLTNSFTVYRRENLPKRWHVNNPERTGDIVVVADVGWLLFGEVLTAKYPAAPLGGVHGYDRHAPSMLATFIGEGPRFADGAVVEPFDNVEVYGIIAEILGLTPVETDGDLTNVEHLLTPLSAE